MLNRGPNAVESPPGSRFAPPTLHWISAFISVHRRFLLRAFASLRETFFGCGGRPRWVIRGEFTPSLAAPAKCALRFASRLTGTRNLGLLPPTFAFRLSLFPAP